MSKQPTREQRIEFAQEESLAVLARASAPMSAATIATRCEGLSVADVANATHRLEKANVITSVGGPNGCFLYQLALPVPVAVPAAVPEPLKPIKYPPQAFVGTANGPVPVETFDSLDVIYPPKKKETKLRNFSNGPFVTIKTPEPNPDKERLDRAADTFADALGVQTCVMQCSYISVQIAELIANLDRPPRMVLADLIAGMHLISKAGKQLELDHP